MHYSLLPSLLLQILIVGYRPGPANIYALTMSLKYGRKASLVMWLGLLSGFVLATSIVAVITHYIGIVIGDYVAYLKYLGASYILYLAYRIWKSSNQSTSAQKDCTFFHGFMVQLTNAKMILFSTTVYSTFVLPYSDRLTDLFDISLWLLLAGPGGNLAWLLAGRVLRRFSEKYHTQVDFISIVALVICAFFIIIA